MNDPATPEKRPVRLRWFLYSAIVCVGFFAGLNWLVESLERQGVVHTHDPDDQVQYLTETIWERDGDRWVTTPYGAEHFTHDTFAAEGDGPRVFITGGSWALGTPYTMQGAPPKPGSIPSFLEAWLRSELGPQVDVVNAGAGGQNSNRVVQVAKEALEHDPDVLVVATCNNEGAMTPDRLEAWLKEQGGYRLLSKLLASDEEPERTIFTAQDVELDAGAAAYEANLEAIAAASKEAGVPLVLATLPQHVLYEGLGEGHRPDITSLPDFWYAEPAYHEPLPQPPWLDQVNPCLGVLVLQEAGEWELSLALTRMCLPEHSLGAKPVLVALARANLGRETEEDHRFLDAHFGPCVARGMAEVRNGQPEAALATLSTCEDHIDEALRWSGLAAAAMKDHARARELLQHSIEMNPHNRCRPSFNRIVRTVAARHPHVALADLELAAEELAPDGLPGDDLFFDSCHMNWRGYGAMARALADTLGPMLGADPASLDPEALGIALGLPQGDAVEQIVFAYSDRGERLPEP